MRDRSPFRAARRMLLWTLALTPLATVSAAPRDAESSTADQLWRRGIELVVSGEFDAADDAFEKLPETVPVADKVVDWLEEFEQQQQERHRLDQVEFDRYVGYAQQRIEREEYDIALRWALLAADVIRNRDDLLEQAWLKDLVEKSLTTAEEHRREHEWSDAWAYYSRLGDLYDREPKYKKLEREVLTLWRLDEMFGEKGNWREGIEKVRWEDAARALECVALYYVHEPDFREVTQAGLEQMLLLADSKGAQKAFEGLGNDQLRRQFVVRIRERLNRVDDAPVVSRRDASQHFRRVLDINRQTVRLPEELVISEMVRGAFDPLDEFTGVIWPRAAEEFDKHTRGDFIGVGISIVQNRVTDEIEVVSPLEDTPAYRAGIQAGDIVTHVDGDPIKGKSINAVVDAITGPEGTEVSLTVRREDKEMVYRLARARVKIQSVKGIRRDQNNQERWDHWLDKENGIGYVRVTNFQANTVEDVQNVLNELENEKLRGLVLDLRDNPGGLLDSAYDMASLFLDRGQRVVSIKGRDAQEDDVLRTVRSGPWAHLPVAVLVNENSASASEIVAGAVQDNKHGIVIGARTFGKFSVQNLIQLSRSNAKLKITTAKYYLPNGRSLHREVTSSEWGVEPDIPVRLVRWERVNVWEARRDADRLGPPKPESITDAENVEGDDAEHPASKDDEKEEEKESKLPPLEQLDENERPKLDAQLDTALLVLRVKLLGEQYPTFASASTTTSNRPDETQAPAHP